MSEIEIIAVFFGVLGVYLTVKQNAWCWAAGIVNVTLYAYLFFENKLFGDAGLQVFYIFMSYYGWQQWVYGGEKNSELQVRHISIKEIKIILLIGLPLFFILSYFLKQSQGSLPYWDAFTTTLSLAATWMTTRKIIENWSLWIFTDIIYVFIYLYKELNLTAALYLGFTILAVLGWTTWAKEIKKTS